ncbi:hypothetical protein [Peribacillus frigoritolerans]|uniref:hypothetical protein n=1 Tax=Peribacillus frigoritolerans TaxID=450367 RepID=UPI001F4F889D|nr:hypothetical protein [Peribacillus frigoritolerans]MCK2018858.1 hypothetical protein [Peribacillus frigoritolerans]
MKYDQRALLNLLDPTTIQGLLNIYNLSLKHVAGRMDCTVPAVHYLIKNDKLKDWQKERILELFSDHGLEVAELLLVNQMVNRRKGAGTWK